MQACMTIFLGLSQLTALGRLHKKFITVQRWILEHFVTFVNRKKLLIISTTFPLLAMAGFLGQSLRVNNCQLLGCLP